MGANLSKLQITNQKKLLKRDKNLIACENAERRFHLKNINSEKREGSIQH